MSNIVIKMLADADVAGVTNYLKKHGLTLDERNYSTVGEAAGAITHNTGAILINELACMNALGGREEVIKKLRAADNDVRIVFCLDKHGEEKEFRAFCKSYRVTDLFYPDRSGATDLAKIVPVLAKGRLPAETAAAAEEKSAGILGRIQRLTGVSATDPAPQIIERRVEVPVDRIVEKIVEKRVEVPVDRVVEVPVERVVEKIVEKRVEVEVPVEVPVERVITHLIPDMPGRMIGVFNVCRGAGASTMALSIAAEAARRGINTFLVGADGTDDFKHAKKVKKLAISYKPDAFEEALMSVLNGETKLVVVDFGLLLDIDCEGNVYDELTSKTATFERLAKCSAIFGMGHSAPWHFKKIRCLEKQLEQHQPTFITDCKETKNIPSRDELTPEAIVDRLFQPQDQPGKGILGAVSAAAF